jgi:hypothetical protein
MENPRMLGFPSYVIGKFLKILTDNGLTVVVINQITPPPLPKRVVTGIYYPNTYSKDIMQNEMP